MTVQTPSDILKQATGMSIVWSVVMIVLGFLAVLLPFGTGLGVSMAVGWIIFFSGFVYLAYAFTAQSAGAVIWRILIGVFYVAGGGYLAFHPGLALESLTLVMAAIFLLEGLLEIAVFFQFRVLPGSGWILFDGIVTLVLAYLIWRPWPASSTWAIGTLLGINLILSGFTRLTYSLAGRKTLNAMAS